MKLILLSMIVCASHVYAMDSDDESNPSKKRNISTIAPQVFYAASSSASASNTQSLSDLDDEDHIGHAVNITSYAAASALVNTLFPDDTQPMFLDDQDKYITWEAFIKARKIQENKKSQKPRTRDRDE